MARDFGPKAAIIIELPQDFRGFARLRPSDKFRYDRGRKRRLFLGRRAL